MRDRNVEDTSYRSMTSHTRTHARTQTRTQTHTRSFTRLQEMT